MEYLHLHQLPLANEYLLIALKYGKDPLIYNELGVLYFHYKQYNQAKDYLLDALNLIPNSSLNCNELMLSIYLNLGHVYRELLYYFFLMLVIM